LWIWPPQYAASVDFLSGQLLWIRTLPNFVNNPHKDEPIGRCLTPVERLEDRNLTALALFYQAYDALHLAFCSGATADQEDVKPVARDFRNAFTVLREQPLKAYYDAIGERFFRWLG
jgi:hypothetical protein